MSKKSPNNPKVKRKVQQAVKNGKAEAVKYDDTESQHIIDGKIRERIERQKQCRVTFLEAIRLRCECDEMLKQLDGKDNKKIKMQWQGMTCPRDILLATFNITHHNFKEAWSSYNYYVQALKNDGLTDEQIDKVRLDGEYIKNEKTEEGKPETGSENYIG